jgi:SulP family sulfate permease
LGRDHIFPDKRSAIQTIFDRLDRGICATCHVRLFWECQALPPPSAAEDLHPSKDRDSSLSSE